MLLEQTYNRKRPNHICYCWHPLLQISALAQQNSVGLSCYGYKIGRWGDLAWLCLSTDDKVGMCVTERSYSWVVSHLLTECIISISNSVALKLYHPWPFLNFCYLTKIWGIFYWQLHKLCSLFNHILFILWPLNAQISQFKKHCSKASWLFSH